MSQPAFSKVLTAELPITVRPATVSDGWGAVGKGVTVKAVIQFGDIDVATIQTDGSIAPVVGHEREEKEKLRSFGVEVTNVYDSILIRDYEDVVLE